MSNTIILLFLKLAQKYDTYNEIMFAIPAGIHYNEAIKKGKTPEKRRSESYGKEQSAQG
jgi:hypothetical protein